MKAKKGMKPKVGMPMADIPEMKSGGAVEMRAEGGRAPGNLGKFKRGGRASGGSASLSNAAAMSPESEAKGSGSAPTAKVDSKND